MAIRDAKSISDCVQVLPIEDLMWLVGNVATAIARHMEMTEAQVYRRLAEEADTDPELQAPPT